MSSSGRVTWGYHGVTAGLTQANTSVGKCYFHVLNTYNYMYYVFFNILIYIIYKRTLVVSSIALAEWRLGKVLRPAWKVLILYLVHRLFFVPGFHTIFMYIFFTHMHVFLHYYVYDLLMLLARNFYSLFCLLTEYVVYLFHFFLSLSD